MKALLEEVLPLAFFVRFLDIPERRTRCRYLGRDNDSYDAHLRLSGKQIDFGFWKPEYFVEVSSAQFPKEHLRREAMKLYGLVFSDPDIYPTGTRRCGNRQVISHAVARNGEALVEDVTHWVRKAVHNKLSKDYPSPSILLVRVVPDRPLFLSEWSQVIRAVPRQQEQNTFEMIFLVDPSTGVVFLAG